MIKYSFVKVETYESTEKSHFCIQEITKGRSMNQSNKAVTPTSQIFKHRSSNDLENEKCHDQINVYKGIDDVTGNFGFFNIMLMKNKKQKR